MRAEAALTSSLTLSLSSYIFSGRVFSAFKSHALIRGSCGRTHPTTLAVKLNHLAKSSARHVQEIACEAWIYTLLTDHDLTTHFHGVFVPIEPGRGAGAVVASILVHAGQPMTEAEGRDLAPSDKYVES